jgi:hypothetical protein
MITPSGLDPRLNSLQETYMQKGLLRLGNRDLPKDLFVDLLTAQDCTGHLFQLVKIRYTPRARELPIAAMTSFRILEKN